MVWWGGGGGGEFGEVLDDGEEAAVGGDIGAEDTGDFQEHGVAAGWVLFDGVGIWDLGSRLIQGGDCLSMELNVLTM